MQFVILLSAMLAYTRHPFPGFLIKKQIAGNRRGQRERGKGGIINIAIS